MELTTKQVQILKAVKVKKYSTWNTALYSGNGTVNRTNGDTYLKLSVNADKADLKRPFILPTLEKGHYSLEGDGVRVGSALIKQTENPEDFPEGWGENFDLIWMGTLKELLTHYEDVRGFTGDRPGRYILSGVSLETFGEKSLLNLVEVDGYRLSYSNPKAKGWKKTKSFIVPPEPFEVLRKIKGEDLNRAIFIHADSHHLQFKVLNLIEVTTRLIEGSFPPWREILPNHDNYYEVETERLKEKLKEFKKISRDDPFLDFSFSGKFLTLTSGIDSLAFNASINCKGESDFTIRLNASYVLDCLREGATKFEVRDEESGVLINGTKVVMPVNRS